MLVVLTVLPAVVRHGESVCATAPLGTAAVQEYLIQPVKQKTLLVLPLKEPIELALRGAEELVDSTRSTLDAAKAALIPLEAAVDAAQLTVDGAEETLRGVQAAFAVGLQAANAIANFGLNGLVSIREISFNARLDVAAGGSFSGSVRAVFAGAAETTVSLDVNLYDITSMARQLAEHIGSGFSSLF